MSRSIPLPALLILLGQAIAFQSSQAFHRWDTALSSYLDSLQNQVVNGNASPAVLTPSTTEAVAADGVPFAHATISYFDSANLASKGPRATKDWGEPQDGTRKLADDGDFRTGAWYCTEGGWPSPNEKAHTEMFYVLSGSGCLGDADGTTHYFGPGDHVIIPKGHTGRWDVFTPIHKVWAVNAHQRIEETSYPIRVQVDRYHTFAAQYLQANQGQDPLFRSSSAAIAYNTFYDVGPTSVGVWTCPSGETVPVSNGARSFFHLLEGVVVVTDGATGHAKRCVPGDTVQLAEGWSGFVDVIQPAKMLWTTAA